MAPVHVLMLNVWPFCCPFPLVILFAKTSKRLTMEKTKGVWSWRHAPTIPADVGARNQHQWHSDRWYWGPSQQGREKIDNARQPKPTTAIQQHGSNWWGWLEKESAVWCTKNWCNVSTSQWLIRSWCFINEWSDNFMHRLLHSSSSMVVFLLSRKSQGNPFFFLEGCITRPRMTLTTWQQQYNHNKIPTTT